VDAQADGDSVFIDPSFLNLLTRAANMAVLHPRFVTLPVCQCTPVCATIVQVSISLPQGRCMLITCSHSLPVPNAMDSEQQVHSQ